MSYNDEKLYILNKETGGLMLASAYKIVSLSDDELIEHIKRLAEGESIDHLTSKGLDVEDPWEAIWFSGKAVAEHAENHKDFAALVEGFTPEDLAEVGQWAYQTESIWDSFYEALRYGANKVREEIEKVRAAE